MTINKAMNIALTGLNAHQAALNVVSHNIANINTEGYRRQQVHFAEMRTPLYDNSVSGQIASLAGVKIDGIKTASNDYLNDYFRKQNALYEGLQTGADIAAGVAGLLDELQDSALGDSLNAFYEAANSLNQNPTDYSLRVNFVAKAKAVANKFNALDTSLKNYATSVMGDGKGADAVSQIGTDINALTGKLKNLADINLQLSRTPNDTNLQSQRDQILSDISSYGNVTVELTERGTANVSIGNYDLVRGNKVVGELTYQNNKDSSGKSPRIQYYNTETKQTVENIKDSFTSGSIGGALTGINTLTQAQGDLDKLANAFMKQMNGIQQYANGNEQAYYYDRQKDVLVKNPLALFNGTNAGDIKINDDVYNNPDLVAAARLDDTSAVNWKKAVGNGDNALFFYNAKSAKLTDLDGLSMQDFLIAMGTKAALSADDLQKQADAQGSIVDSINNQILSETGVNLDEELSNMIIYQQGYNASARMFSTCVEVFDTLVNLGK